MEKVLFISNITKKIGSFSIVSIDAAKECGLQFQMAANWSGAGEEQIESDQKEYNVKIHNIPIDRSPYSLRNKKAYKQLVEIIRQENIDYIHCNTPVGGVLGRLAGKKCGVKKVIYQAHGFHFYKGAPLKNWLLYYPIERLLAHWTDAIITINQEDYARAQKFHLRNHGKVYYVPGVGIDTTKYLIDKKSRIEKREELGITADQFVIISVGEINTNKNNRVVIEAIAKTGRKDVQYLLCGVGAEQSRLKELSEKLGIQKQIHFLGYRSDISELYQAADAFALPSFREGLSRSLMEAMASGLPCIVSDIRGNRDLIENGQGGYLYNPKNVESVLNAILALFKEKKEGKETGKINMQKVKEFDRDLVSQMIMRIYQEIGDIK